MPDVKYAVAVWGGWSESKIDALAIYANRLAVTSGVYQYVAATDCGYL